MRFISYVKGAQAKSESHSERKKCPTFARRMYSMYINMNADENNSSLIQFYLPRKPTILDISMSSMPLNKKKDSQQFCRIDGFSFFPSSLAVSIKLPEGSKANTFPHSGNIVMVWAAKCDLYTEMAEIRLCFRYKVLLLKAAQVKCVSALGHER